MKKLLNALRPILFFAPAVINTVVVLWVFVYPWLGTPDGIHIPWQMLLVLGLFWLSGILLSLGKGYGGIPAIGVSLYLMLESSSGYAGMSHIDWQPIAAVTIAYYLICGHLARKNRG